MENVRKIKIKLENIWIDLIRSIYAPYKKDLVFLGIVFPKYQQATVVDIEASYKSMPAISYDKYDQAYTSVQKHDWKLWARCRRRISCIRRQDRNSRETYWKSTRHAECPGCYRNCNGREGGGRNFTKYTGASPTTPVQRDVR